MSGAWEQAVNSVLPKESPVRDRDDLAGPQSPSWISEVGYKLVFDGSGPEGWHVWRKASVTSSSAVRVDNSQQSGGHSPDTYATQGTLYVWANLNLALFDGQDTTFGQLYNLGAQSLDPLVHPPQANSATSIPSFRETADLLANARKFLEDKADEVGKLASEVESSSALSGETAKALHQTVQTFGLNLSTFAKDLGRDDVVNQLRTTGASLETGVNQLLQAFQAWKLTQLSHPIHAVKNALDRYDLNATVDGEQLTGMQHAVGSALNADFGKNLDVEAKSLWMDNYAVQLDGPGGEMFNSVQGQIQTTHGITPESIEFGTSGGGTGGNQQQELDKYKQQVEEQQQKYEDQLKEQQEQQKEQQQKYEDQLNEQQEQQKQEQEQQQQDLQEQQEQQQDLQEQQEQQQDLQEQQNVPPENFGESSQVDTGGTGGDTSGGTGEDSDFDLPDTDTGTDEETGGTQQNEFGGGNGIGSDNEQNGTFTPPPPSIGNFGSSQLNPNMMSKLDPNGSGGSNVVGPDGTVVTNPDGTPLSIPPDSKINPDGTVTKADGSLLRDPQGNLVKVPPGSSIQQSFPPGSVVNPDGTVTNPDGTQVRDSHGNLVKVPPNSAFHPNSQGSSTLYPFGKTNLSPNLSPDLHTTGNKHGFGTGSGLETNNKRVGGFGSAEINDPTRRSTVNSSALDDAMRKPTNPSTESSFKGAKGGAGGQQPMIPPPPMAGGGGGGDQNKDRQRTTWLSEDADTWNTEDGFTGAIGR
ncbi:hypothetical protein [Saccharopolyspora sp. NPDC002376]